MEREEAIEIVRNIYQTDKEKEALATLIPELAKSDDEMMEEIIEYLRGLSVKYDSVAGKPKRVIKEWVAYLEKQKDKNCLACDQHLKGYLAGRKVTEEEKQKEQKPVDGKEYSSPECGTTAGVWGEEDKTNGWAGEDLSRYLSCLRRLGTGNPQQPETINSLWFKEHCHPQPKQEWSGEDEKVINTIVSVLGQYTDYKLEYKSGSGTSSGCATPRYSKEIDWLKSLRQQPRKEIYQAAKHDLAIKFMNYLDENRPEEKMSLSNGECEDIDKAFKENDWAKIIRYIEKYSSHNSRN